MSKRNYSLSTIKILFAWSGNQCAHPECTNPVVEPGTEDSDEAVIAHICHIYAINENGPRGNPELTEEELNSLENLILLCPNHHTIVDSQHETYTAEKLKKWKQDHEAKIKERYPADSDIFHSDKLPLSYFPIELIDQNIKEKVALLRKSRFFNEFDKVRTSLSLAGRLVDGELCRGTNEIRSQALSWCARLLSSTQELSKAEEYLKLAKDLDPSHESNIADAFIMSAQGDKNGALSVLAQIDSPFSQSAALIIVGNHEGATGALTWVESTRLDFASLDSDGKYFYLACQFELEHWEAAQDATDLLTDQDFEITPNLYHIAAMAHLLKAVPTELRSDVAHQLPFEAARFPLASNEAGMATRRIAQHYFTNAAEVAYQLNLPKAATLADQYALWLELKDPKNSDNGRQRLEEKLRDTKLALHLVPLGLQFGINLNLAAVEQEIEQQITLHGKITADAAIARFSLVYTKETREDAANYIGQQSEELAEYFDRKAMRILQVDLYAQAGLAERANECLESLLEEGLSEIEEGRLRREISEAEGTDPAEVREIQFQQSDSLGDLMFLVDALEDKQDWENLCKYVSLLFERTRSISNAERLANALHNACRSEQLVEFLKQNGDLLSESDILQMFYSVALYQEGMLVEARSELAKLGNGRADSNYRTLKVGLEIALGNWNSLLAFVANEYSEKNKRSAHDLMKTAQLALHLNSPHAKDLISAAAEKGAEDATVLAAAHFLASNAGFESETQAIQWLHKAAELSEEDGPIQKMSLKDVLDRKPDWERRESDTWTLLKHGEIPMFLAAESLNMSLIDLTIIPAFSNLSVNDPRGRRVIPAYSGKRLSTSFNVSEMTAGIDASTLLTLSYLNLLDVVLDAFGEVHVPHSTLTWLFEEKQKVAFHQPSLIRNAHQIRNLVAEDLLEEFIPSTTADDNLSLQIGDELASLISEAEKTRENDNTQHIVVRSSPVHRLSSLMEEEADLTEHAAVMCSCLAVIKKLKEKAQITAEEEKKAHAYLQLHEKPWPNQPEINDGAILYLDSLSITYLLHVGVLGKIKVAGLTPTASPKAISEANALIAYEGISGRVNEAIERIRFAISSRIETGKIKVGRLNNTAELKDQSISEHPTINLMALARDCDAIISDDRFLNQHAHIGDGSEQTAVFSTLDILDALVSTEIISVEKQMEHKTLLRRTGYLFMPVSDDELYLHLESSVVENGNLRETAELKAIRENVLQVRMGSWLQLPEEILWLSAMLKTFIRVLKKLWETDSNIPAITARSDWVLEQIDSRGWVHGFGPGDGDNIVKTGRAADILTLLAPPSDVPQEIKDAYWSWIEDRILTPTKEQFPDLYSQIVRLYMKQIEEMTEMDPTGGNQDEQ